MTCRSVTAFATCALLMGCGVTSEPGDVGGSPAQPQTSCVTASECSAAQHCTAGECLDAEAADPERRPNQAPSIVITSPSAGVVVLAGQPVLLIAQVTDDGPYEQLDVQWHTNRGGALGAAPVDAEGRASLEVVDLLAGDHELTVVVADGEDVWQQDSVSITIDGRPNRPVVALNPEHPVVSDDLTLVIVHPASDENRASTALTYRYRWFVDELARPDISGPTVPAIATLRGQTWSVQVAASDPYGFGGTSVAEVTIGNAPPTCESATLLPPVADTTTALACLCVERSEPDKGDKTLDRCTFYDGDVVLAQVDGENGACVLDAEQTTRGVTVRCELVPADERDEGEPAWTEAVLVDNAHPTRPVVVMSPSTGTATEGFTCQVLEPSTDADGDDLSYETAWYVNGYPNAPPYPGAVSPVDLVRDGAGQPARGGDTLHCEVVARDAIGEISLAGPSEPLVLSNTPPSGGSCVVTPSEGVTATSVLTCTPSGALDLDEDPVTWSFSWTVTGPGLDPQSLNGAIIEITSYPPVTGPKLPGFYFQRDALVSCLAIPSDGVAQGPPISCGDPILVGNSLPTIWEVLLEPAGDIALDEPVTCTYAGWSDPDDIDPVEVRYSWLKIEGAEISLAEEESDGFGESLIPSEAGLEPGDVITCIARPFNGPDEGEGTYATYNATIASNP